MRRFARRPMLLSAIGITLVAAMVVSAALVVQRHVFAAAPLPPRHVTHGSRADALLGSLSLVAQINAARLPQADPAKITRRTLPALSGWSATQRQAALHGPAPAGINQPDPTTATRPTPETPVPTGTFQGQAEGNIAPADIGLAVGNGYIVQVVNAAIAVYSTVGALLPGWPKTSQSFFNVPAANQQYSPRALYDSISGHFFILFDDTETSAMPTATYYLAVSATINPTGNWNIYSTDVQADVGTGSAAFAANPGLGIDTQAIYLSGNHFRFSDNQFTDAFVDFANITQLEAGMPSVTMHSFTQLRTGNGPAYGVMPATQYGASRSEMLVDTDHTCTAAICTGYDVWAISDPNGPLPRLSWVNITGPAWSLAPAANQPGAGGANSIGTPDPSVSSAPIWRDGLLTFAITTGYNNGAAMNVAAVEWVALAVSLDAGDQSCGNPPNRCSNIIGATVNDSNLIGYGDTKDAYAPALAVDTDGNFLMTFTFSSTTHPTIVSLLSHRATTPPGTIAGPAQTLVQGQSSGFWPTFRWGTYSAAAIDPASCTFVGCYKIWFSGMYAAANGTWGTTISTAQMSIDQV